MIKMLAMAALLLAAGVTMAASAPTIVVIDDFADVSAWSAHPADGVKLALAADDGALRLDFAFTGGGYAIARREVDLELPNNYAITYRLRGQAPVEHLEMKLIDPSGENVWWHVRRDLVWPTEWQTMRTKKRQISFAWGPQGGGELRKVAAIEFAVTAGMGGQGSVWIDDLKVVPLPVSAGPLPTPKVTASSSERGHAPRRAVDGDPKTHWAAARRDKAPAFTLDFGQPQEFGGLVVDWAPGRHPTEYMVEGDDGSGRWRSLLLVTGSDGGRDFLYLPESEEERVRLRATSPGPAPAITGVSVEPLTWSATREAFVMNLAREARRGLYPRGMLGEPTAWTVVGPDFDTREGLLGADGALEVGPGEFSLEPFLWIDGKLITWNDVTPIQSLEGAYLPIPRVTWQTDDWQLTVTVADLGRESFSGLIVRYLLQNLGAERRTARLVVALRPLQVNPPSQNLNIIGGTARVQNIALNGTNVEVDGQPRVQLLTKPDVFGASTFYGGDIVADWLEQGKIAPAQVVSDAMGAASAALAWDLSIDSGMAHDVNLIVPLHGQLMPADLKAGLAMRAAVTYWHEQLNRVKIEGPSAAQAAINAMKAQLGWILVNRAGPAIQPGTRSYARSWIRDGALTSAALLRLGHADDVRDFLLWYAPHQYENGKIPCVVDARGADPVPEHDSTGEFIYLVAEYWRFTKDRAVLDAMWPRVVAGVAYLESLLDQRRTAEFEAPELRHFYGILPPSISHEGYSAKPMHSYWDNFFCLRGLKDAALLADVLVAAGVDSLALEAVRLAAARDRFAGDLKASIAAAMAFHKIDYVPGCADLGDFDPTSTTIALDPCEAADLLPDGALERTFERYWEFFEARRGGAAWDAFTPYEVRCIGAFARLGWTDRAWEMVDWFLGQQAVRGWEVWGEVVASDQEKARFIGDMPHGWVGSDFVRGVGDLIED